MWATTTIYFVIEETPCVCLTSYTSPRKITIKNGRDDHPTHKKKDHQTVCSWTYKYQIPRYQYIILQLLLYSYIIIKTQSPYSCCSPFSHLVADYHVFQKVSSRCWCSFPRLRPVRSLLPHSCKEDKKH